MMAMNDRSLIDTADMASHDNFPSAEELQKFFTAELKSLCDWLMKYLNISILGGENLHAVMDLI